MKYDCWHKEYKNGLKYLDQGDLKSAAKCGSDCFKISEHFFKSGDGSQKILALDFYFKSALLLKSCCELNGCLEHVEQHYLMAIHSLNTVHHNKKLTLDVRFKARDLCFRLKGFLEVFYFEHDQLTQFRHFKKISRKKYPDLTII